LNFQAEVIILKIIFESNYKIQEIHTNEEDDVINLKSKSSHPPNIWNDDVDDDISDMHILIHITNTLNIYEFNLKKRIHHSIL